MKNTNNKINNCKKTIESYHNAKTERIYKLFKRAGYGRIIVENDKEIESIIYKGVAKLLHSRYGNIVDENELYDRLTMYGRIYTMDLEQKNGFYDDNTAHIGINHFLNRLSNTLLHEIIHKAGALSFNEAFYNLPTVYKEAGAEIISSETLKSEYCKEFIYNGNWAKFPDKLQSRYLLCSLVNQMNIAIGEEYLADTIINGTDSFENKAKEVFGQEGFERYTKELEAIVDKERKYWKKDINDKNTKLSAEKELDSLVDEWQNNLLIDVFDKKAKEVTTYGESLNLLKSLKDLSEYRVKRDSMGKNYSDSFFKEFFEEKKSEFQRRFSDKEFKIEYDETEWSKKYRYRSLEETVKNDRDRLKRMKSIYEKNGFFGRILNKNVTENQNVLPKESVSSFEERIRIEVNKIVTQNTETKANPIPDDIIK